MSKSVRLCVSVCLTVYSCVCSVSKSVRLCVFCVQECKVVCACARVCVCEIEQKGHVGSTWAFGKVHLIVCSYFHSSNTARFFVSYGFVAFDRLLHLSLGPCTLTPQTCTHMPPHAPIAVSLVPRLSILGLFIFCIFKSVQIYRVFNQIK